MKNQLSAYSSNFIYFPLPYHYAGYQYSKVTQNGTLTLMSTVGVPYGLYARLALVAITKLACMADKNTIEDISLYEMLNDLREAKPRGAQLDKFEKQLESWATTVINFMYEDDTWRTYRNLLLIKEGRFALQKNLKENEKVQITFSDDGLEFFRSNLIPIPTDAVREIEQSFDFDVLSWLVLTIYQCREKNSILTPWQSLYTQFQISPKNYPKFRTNFTETLLEVKKRFYPKAKIHKSREGGLIIENSPLLTDERTLLMPSFRQDKENPS